MRRPNFKGWVTRELSYLSGEDTLKFRRLSFLAQTSVPRLRERLILYAVEINRVDKLRNYLFQVEMLEELNELAQVLDGQDLNDPSLVEKVQLPSRYSKALQSFRVAYNRIDSRNESKKLRWEKSIQLQKEKGVPSSQIYSFLNLDAGNVNTYLKHGAIDKISLENATRIMKYLYSL